MNRLQDLLDQFRHLDFLGPVALRLYLFPIFLMAGVSKIDLTTGMPYPYVAGYFGSLGIPFPEIGAYLAGYTELLGAFLLLAGFAVRWVAVPLMVTMVVAAWSAHWDNGWAAITPSNPAPICIEGSRAAAQADPVSLIAKCYNVTPRTIEGSERLSKARAILKQHGNYDWLTARGSIVMLNNGVEFATTYFIMLLMLFFVGAGRYFSIDYWVHKLFRDRGMHWPHHD